LILLSDANVLIDLGYVQGLSLLTQLAPTEVLDVVLLECEDERQPEIVEAVRAADITVVETEAAWISAARVYRTPELSTEDVLNLYYAKIFGRVLLAGDKPLRDQCEIRGVEVHGSIWLVEEALTRNLVAPDELCRWLKVWPSLGRRLPAPEIKRLRGLLGC
jgi:hypothetical protein